jgi:hypothetical protein
MTTIEHEIVSHFDTYEDYLDSKITQEHLYYLGSRDVARQLFGLGCIGGSEVMEPGQGYQSSRRERVADIQRIQDESAMV